MHCAFTGSTHSPYDFPEGKAPVWKGNEPRFMSSVYYADHCLNNFIKACKKENWYKNTIFVLVADHGHASPFNTNPSVAQFFRIPLLIFGEPIKKEFRGTHIDAIGSQSDIATTLLRQMHGDVKHYTWSKDLLNPKVPQFALHTVIRGYGWVTPKGHFTWHMDGKMFQENTFDAKHIGLEKLRCHALMSLLYKQYKSL
jgi:phosphoglycerol transferase MdoB-like AlkP superfamily enzyme